jgi:hypothetical protein
VTTLTILLPDDTCERLKQLAKSRGVSLGRLIEELGTAALAAHDAENRFRLLAAGADRQKALDVLARLDADDGVQRP